MNKLLDCFELSPGTDYKRIAQEILLGYRPLLIWGILRESEVNPGCYTANAVDIKSGDKLFFEFYPDNICLYGSKDNPVVTSKLKNFIDNYE